jgi:hypothetical protein
VNVSHRDDFHMSFAICHISPPKSHTDMKGLARVGSTNWVMPWHISGRRKLEFLHVCIDVHSLRGGGRGSRYCVFLFKLRHEESARKNPRNGFSTFQEHDYQAVCLNQCQGELQHSKTPLPRKRTIKKWENAGVCHLGIEA